MGRRSELNDATSRRCRRECSGGKPAGGRGHTGRAAAAVPSRSVATRTAPPRPGPARCIGDAQGRGTCVHKRRAGRRAGAMLAGPVTWQLPGKGGEPWHGRTSRLRCSALERWATGWQPVLCAPASRRSSGTARWRRAQMSTIGVAGTDRVVAMAGAQRPDVILLDAPVSGSKDPAERGQLTIFAAGPAEARACRSAVRRARPAHDLGRRGRGRDAAEAGEQHLAGVRGRSGCRVRGSCSPAGS